MKLSRFAAPTDIPAAGARIPALSVRAVFVVAGVLLSLVDYKFTVWLAVGIVLSLATAWSPRHLPAWGLILYLAAGRFAHHANLSWQFLVLLAGVHLLHVLGLLTLELPWRSWVQPRVFVAPLRRFLIIQIPTQLLAIVALTVLGTHSNGRRPVTLAEFAVVGVMALVALAVVLSRPGSDDSTESSSTPRELRSTR